MAKISFSDIENAFLFVSMDMYGMNSAIINKDTGEIRYHSEMTDLDEIGEDEELEGDQWVEIPHKNDLGLGRNLVFEFVAEHLPQEYDEVNEIFHHRGAYGRYKALLDRYGLLQKWYDFEHTQEEQAIRQWCERNGIELID